MNSIVLLGRTTSTIELKRTQAGKSVATFSLAVKRPFTKDITDFHTIVAWEKQAETLSKYVKKGDQICIRGYLTTRNWQDSHGNRRYATEVLAEEVSFVDNRESSTEAKLYTPSLYAQAQSNQRFEELSSAEGLPF